MPNLITHALFADDVREQLNLPLLNHNRKFMITGAQGPDFLFFHHTTPAKYLIPSDIRQYGSLFHKEKVNEFYASALHSIRHEKNRIIKNEMTAYVCGHLCHWAMDGTFHPYIYYRTGNYSNKSAAAHHRFESLLDAAMLKYKKNLTISEYDPSVECLSDELPVARAICRVYVPAIETIYGKKVSPKDFVDDLHEWKFMQKVFRDPNNYKKRILQPLEKIFGMDNVLSGFSVPNVCEDNVDICNLLHREWKNPASLEISNASLLDLYQIAQAKALMAIHLFLKVIDHPEDEAELLGFLGERNYEMGLAGSPEAKEFDLIDLSL